MCRNFNGANENEVSAKMIIIASEYGIFCTKEIRIDTGSFGYGLRTSDGTFIWNSSHKRCQEILKDIIKHVNKYSLKRGVVFNYKIYELPPDEYDKESKRDE